MICWELYWKGAEIGTSSTPATWVLLKLMSEEPNQIGSSILLLANGQLATVYGAAILWRPPRSIVRSLTHPRRRTAAFLPGIAIGRAWLKPWPGPIPPRHMRMSALPTSDRSWV